MEKLPQLDENDLMRMLGEKDVFIEQMRKVISQLEKTITLMEAEKNKEPAHAEAT